MTKRKKPGIVHAFPEAAKQLTRTRIERSDPFWTVCKKILIGFVDEMSGEQIVALQWKAVEILNTDERLRAMRKPGAVVPFGGQLP